MPKLLHKISFAFVCLQLRTDCDPILLLRTDIAFVMLPPTTFILLFLSCAHLIACHDPLYARAACSSSYTACNPKGAATTNEPPVGTALSSLFVDVVNTLDSANLAKRDAERARALIESRASGGSLCCNYLASMISMVGVDH